MRVLTVYKKDSKLRKARFFTKWRSSTLVGKVRELGQENERQRDEIDSIRTEWKQSIKSFVGQKQEFETKLQKMAQLIHEKLLEKEQKFK